MPQKRTEELLQAGYRYALSLRCKPEDARELVHDAWIRLSAQLVPLINKPRLFRTVRNIFIDRYRREQLLILESIDEHIEELSEVATAIDRQVDSAELDACLSRLRAPEREALFLNVIEGYTVAEIVKLTGRPRGTVLSLLHRGRQKMKSMLLASKRIGEVQQSGGQDDA